MQEISKFQVITVVFLFMFVFIVGAIYSNTKDVAENKANTNKEINMIEKRSDTNLENSIPVQYSPESLERRINDLEQRFNQLSKVGNDANLSELNCKIYGVVDGNREVQLTPSESIRQARDFGKEMVVLCSY